MILFLYDIIKSECLKITLNIRHYEGYIRDKVRQTQQSSLKRR